ncbi:hypothetical protein ACLKA6_009745 [Drosophila palustris]
MTRARPYLPLQLEEFLKFEQTLQDEGVMKNIIVDLVKSSEVSCEKTVLSSWRLLAWHRCQERTEYIMPATSTPVVKRTFASMSTSGSTGTTSRTKATRTSTNKTLKSSSVPSKRLQQNIIIKEIKQETTEVAMERHRAKKAKPQELATPKSSGAPVPRSPAVLSGKLDSPPVPTVATMTRKEELP